MSPTPPASEPRSHRRFRPDRDVVEWKGAYRRYDVVKEVFICFLVVLVLVVACSILFSSPDDHPVTIKSWSTAAPVDFAQTAMTELDGTSTVANLRTALHRHHGRQPEARPGLDRKRRRSEDPDQHRPGLRAEAAGNLAGPPRARRRARPVQERVRRPASPVGQCLREGRGERHLLQRKSRGEKRSLRARRCPHQQPRQRWRGRELLTAPS